MNSIVTCYYYHYFLQKNLAIVQAKHIVQAGQLDPEIVVTPGIFVNKVIEVSNPANESELVAAQMVYP